MICSPSAPSPLLTRNTSMPWDSAAPIVMRGIGQHVHLVLRGGPLGDIHLQAWQVLALDRFAHLDRLAVQHQAPERGRPLDADGDCSAVDIDRFRQAEIDRSDPRQHDLLQHRRQRWAVAAAHQHDFVDQRGILPGNLHAFRGLDHIPAHRRHDRADLLVRRERAMREGRRKRAEVAGAVIGDRPGFGGKGNQGVQRASHLRKAGIPAVRSWSRSQ